VIHSIRRRARVRWVVTVTLLVVAAAAALSAWRWPRPQPAPPPTPTDDPRLIYATPYRNVRPDVRYVGDAACAECHADLAETYRQHPMGRSIVPLTPRAPQPPLDAAAHNPFDNFGLTFLIERRGDRTTHTATLHGPEGKVLARVSRDVAYVIGSGTHGYSYAVEHDGHLFQSPISWYAQGHRWDSSPGYPASLGFDRPIKVGCLFCHANDVDHVAYSLNRYRPPIFGSTTIGCERCHGPGELHVQARERGDVVDGADPTIVNPGRLEPALREAVCQQCHLEGEARVVRRGRRPFDFRPGLPLHLFWSVFVKRPELVGEQRVVSHVEQMVVSRCFKASQGKLGCTSCHDPHRLPAPAEQVAYYRERCVRCHDPGRGQTDCSLASGLRQRRNGDDCVACHMPRSPSADIAHAAVTDHRVPRRPPDRGQRTEDRGPKAGAARRLPPGSIPITAFHADRFPPGDPDLNRDLGLALVDMARQYPDVGASIAAAALPVLEAAVRDWPEDLPSLEGKGYMLVLLHRNEEALDDLQAVLARCPEYEMALDSAAVAAEGLRRREAALGYWRRARAIDPWATHYHLQEARVLATLDDWPRATEAAREAVRLNPAHWEPHLVLASCYAHAGNKDAVEAEFQAVLKLNAPNPEQLRRALDGLLRAGARR
jgi:predicted CXXCH cytochrome family protein